MALPPLSRRSGKSTSNIKQSSVSSRDLILKDEDYFTDTSFNSRHYPEIPIPSAPADNLNHELRIHELEDKVEYLVRFIRHIEIEFTNIITKEIARGVDIKDQPGDPYGSYEEFINSMEKERREYSNYFKK